MDEERIRGALKSEDTTDESIEGPCVRAEELDGVEVYVLCKANTDKLNEHVDTYAPGDGTIQLDKLVSDMACESIDISFFGPDGDRLATGSTQEVRDPDTGECVDGDFQTSTNVVYNFSGSTNSVELSTSGVGGDEVSFNFEGDKLLIVYGGTTAPRNWPEAADVDGMFDIEVTDDIESDYCPGSSDRLRAEIISGVLCGSEDVEVTTVNHITDDEETETIELGQSNERISESIRIPR